jgi:hypothetical protein
MIVSMIGPSPSISNSFEGDTADFLRMSITFSFRSAEPAERVNQGWVGSGKPVISTDSMHTGDE